MKNCPCAHCLLYVIVEDSAHRGLRCPTPYIVPSRKERKMESGGGVVQAPPVDSEGVEPPTSALSGHWIVQCDESRVTASIHPARYHCATSPVGVDGFEPSTSCPKDKRSTRLSYTPCALLRRARRDINAVAVVLRRLSPPPFLGCHTVWRPPSVFPSVACRQCRSSQQQGRCCGPDWSRP